MKTHKLPILALLILGALMALGPIAYAQDNPPASPPPGAGTNGPGGRANMRAAMDKFLTDIKATDAQKEQLKTIFKERNEKIQALRNDSSLSREDRMAKRKEIMEATNTKVKGVLDANQYAKYEEFIKTQGPRGRRGQQPPPSN